METLINYLPELISMAVAVLSAFSAFLITWLRTKSSSLAKNISCLDIRYHDLSKYYIEVDGTRIYLDTLDIQKVEDSK